MSSGHSAKTGKMKGILTDVTKCIGCERCVEACVEVNDLPKDTPSKFKTRKDKLSGDRFTSIVKIAGMDKGDWRMVRRQCMHCLEPSCVSACLVGAFTKRPDGPVEYDADMCIGCRYCMLACPFMIPRYQYEKQLPYVRKCKMDEECRVEGGMPACVSACPTGATIFGTREELIEEANYRIKKEPDKYIDHIWGEKEFGGTSVMYISDVPLGKALKIPTREEMKFMGVEDLMEGSIPHKNHPWVLVTPVQFLTVSTGLFGIWFLRRRSALMNEGGHEQASADGQSDHLENEDK